MSILEQEIYTEKQGQYLAFIITTQKLIVCRQHMLILNLIFELRHRQYIK